MTRMEMWKRMRARAETMEGPAVNNNGHCSYVERCLIGELLTEEQRAKADLGMRISKVCTQFLGARGDEETIYWLGSCQVAHDKHAKAVLSGEMSVEEWRAGMLARLDKLKPEEGEEEQ